MKIGDYFLMSDVTRLSKDQYNSLKTYLKFIGIECTLTYKDIANLSLAGDVLMTWKRSGKLRLLLSDFDDTGLVNCVPYDDILRMISLSETLV